MQWEWEKKKTESSTIRTAYNLVFDVDIFVAVVCRTVKIKVL